MIRQIVLLLGVVWLVAAAVEAAAAGSWVADASLPTIARRGQSYVSPVLTPRPTTPTAGTGITRVHWRYGYDRPTDPRTAVRLCAAGRCVNAEAGRGWSDAFAGLPVATPFRLFLRVPGTTPVTPVMRTGHMQLVVDFD